MIKRSWLFAGVLLVLAALLTFYKIPVASSQGLVIVAEEIDGELPHSAPTSALWDEATAVNVPLSAQNVARPRLYPLDHGARPP